MNPEADSTLQWRIDQVERRIERLEGLDSRLAVLERDVSGAREDIGDNSRAIRELRQEIQQAQRGMSRPEKIALSGAGAALISAVVAAVALLAGGAA